MFIYVLTCIVVVAFFILIGCLIPIKPYTFDLEDVRFDRNYREAEHYERLLRSARRDKQRNHTPGLRPEWQAVVILEDLTDFEFEDFVIAEVWASKGLENERLSQSPFKKEIIEVNRRTAKPVVYA